MTKRASTGRWMLLCASDELGKLLSVESESIVEFYIKAVEQRRIDPSHEVFQVFSDPCKLKYKEGREGRACGRMWTLGFLNRAR